MRHERSSRLTGVAIAIDAVQGDLLGVVALTPIRPDQIVVVFLRLVAAHVSFRGVEDNAGNCELVHYQRIRGDLGWRAAFTGNRQVSQTSVAAMRRAPERAVVRVFTRARIVPNFREVRGLGRMQGVSRAGKG